MTAPAPSLAGFIRSDVQAILADWEQYAQTIPAGRHLDTPALRDHAEQILSAVAADMDTAQSADEQFAKSQGRAPRPDLSDTAAEIHGADRHELGFDLCQTVSEYRALRATVVRLWERQQDIDEASRLREMIRFNEAIDQALAESVQRFMRDLDRARDMLLAVIAHDLRSPLGAMIQSGSYLLRSGELQPGQARAAGIVLTSGNRISLMVQRLLDIAQARFGRQLQVNRAPMDIAETCRQVTTEVATCHPGYTVLAEHRGNTRAALDAQRIQQLLSNLLENAITYGDPAQPVRVFVDGTQPDLCLQVRNHGAPIPPQKLDRIFEPLVRETATPEKLSAGSLGLGLFIVREIARAHGGTVSVTSDALQGTTFRVQLPRDAALQQAQPGLQASALP